MVQKAGGRIPNVKTLYDIIGSGGEGGKEFGRIIDLLIFHEARRAGKKSTIFSDAAGDYRGLDSFTGDRFKKEGTTGYQYKFYPSPLSPKHRKDIEKSLKETAKDQIELKLKKWILVTPMDMTESATRKDKGDITWFENLRKVLGIHFELEHWGHTKIIGLFLDTPSICLFYYPELVDGGQGRKKTIKDVRKRYDDNMIAFHRSIQFVGMSVYKQEATKGVPMEHIYIPLTVVPEAAEETDKDIQRRNPLEFLQPGAKHVILGNPGSGKTTLARFMSLAGISKSLQDRYKAKADDRLTVFVTLRRYADELKSRSNLSILDYIIESVQGDFTLKNADFNFFEYFLESGQAVLLFDGMDELPNPRFKQIVRDRIRSLITTYPGNTTIVTSRIVGYDPPFRFEDKEFGHFRMAKLQLPEMERFVKDWYAVRIDSKKEREQHVLDLVRILRNEEYVAIRELAENPLLLTIITLVHRIDAVLPDERVVLYQKCTETLLNTWHTWKYRGDEVVSKGKVERRNRRRMDVVAYWMQERSVGEGRNQRAVVPYNELLKYLTKHIESEERISDPDTDPQDVAITFLDFIKRKAGLMIEVGDGMYSFVHLTFQEYLTSTCIITDTELGGGDKMWDSIKNYCGNPRWREVIRLFIAGLDSDRTQDFLIGKILKEELDEAKYERALLIGGLLLDAIIPAQERRRKILERLLLSACEIRDQEHLRPFLSLLRIWLADEEENREVLLSIIKDIWLKLPNDEEKLVLSLVTKAIGMSEEDMIDFNAGFLNGKNKAVHSFKLFFHSEVNFEEIDLLIDDIELYSLYLNCISGFSPYSDFVVAAGQGLIMNLEYLESAKGTFIENLMQMRFGMHGQGPYYYYNMGGLLICIKYGFNLFFESPALVKMMYQARYKDLERVVDLGRTLDRTLNRDGAREQARDLVTERARDLGRIEALDRAIERVRRMDNTKDPEVAFDRALKEGIGLWEIIISTAAYYEPYIDIVCDLFSLSPRAQWWEAIRLCFLPKVPERMKIFHEEEWKRIVKSFEEKNSGKLETYKAATLMLIDTSLYKYHCYDNPDESPLNNLAELTRYIDEPPLQIAHCIRDIALGNEKRTADLLAMIECDDPRYREIFDESLWSPVPEEDRNKGKRRKKE